MEDPAPAALPKLQEITIRPLALPEMTQGELEARLLDLVRNSQGIGEEGALEALFPSPKFPDKPLPALVEAWQEKREAWIQKAYGPNGEHAETYAGRVSAAAIALRKRGLLRSVNNGFNSYTYFPAL
ncbi:MAG: hypothetical protein ACOYD4_03855 [Solirubrobacterales bacterium]